MTLAGLGVQPRTLSIARCRRLVDKYFPDYRTYLPRAPLQALFQHPSAQVVITAMRFLLRQKDSPVGTVPGESRFNSSRRIVMRFPLCHCDLPEPFHYASMLVKMRTGMSPEASSLRSTALSRSRRLPPSLFSGGIVCLRRMNGAFRAVDPQALRDLDKYFVSRESRIGPR